jgi:ABC-type sugar transport system ATPase subunit/ribose/xylose/arabinose/galactoside ABC-type transport system permease subunit
LRKEYPGVVALDDVSLCIGAGELHALVGENGAGKSTLVKVIAGQIAPDGGTLEVAGEAVTQFTPQHARRLGITMVPQHPDLFHSLSALENLFVGDWPRGPLRLIAWREMRRRAEAVLAELDVSLPLDSPVSALSVAERQLLQIARALLADAKLLILDEPTAPLGQEETDRLFALIRRLHERGVAIIYISHRLAEVFELAQRVTVLRDGRLVDTRDIGEVTRESLIGMMVGEAHGAAPFSAVPDLGLQPQVLDLPAPAPSSLGETVASGTPTEVGAGLAGEAPGTEVPGLGDGAHPSAVADLGLQPQVLDLPAPAPSSLGETVASGTPTEVGAGLVGEAPGTEVPGLDGGALLRVRGLTIAGKVEDANLEVRAGEIVGIAGVAGSGRDELLRAIAGVEPLDAGEVHVNDQPLRGGGPRAAVRAGVSFVPADRHHEALVLPMTIRENISLGCLKRFAGAAGLIRRAGEVSEAQNLSRRLDVRSFGIEQVVGTLSGGNQQKVALASRLATGPKVFLLEEPTQGVDVKARAEIHRQMQSLAATGVGILLVSSDLPELLALSDRVLVMHRGKIVGELARADATQENILDLALGTAEEGAAAVRVETRRAPVRELGLAALLALLLAGISWRAPGFCTLQNLNDILVNNAYLLIAAVGMTLVILTAGIDISVGSILAVCATITGVTAAAGWPIPAVLAAALVSGLVLGAINAGLITWARIPPIIATLATLTLFRHVLMHFTRGKWIDLPQSFQDFGLSAPEGVPLAVWIALATILIGWAMSRWTVLGRSVYAVGCNPDAAGHMGVSVRGVQASVYLLMGLLVGLAAFAYAGRWSQIQTNTGGGFEMVVITAVVVGGTNIFGGSGTVPGTVIGVLLLGLITASLVPMHIASDWEKAFQGTLILVAVVIDTVRSRKVAGER